MYSSKIAIIEVLFNIITRTLIYFARNFDELRLLKFIEALVTAWLMLLSLSVLIAIINNYSVTSSVFLLVICSDIFIIKLSRYKTI